MQLPPWQSWPTAPQSWGSFARSGTHDPLEHVSGALHVLPAQHGCPLPPHVPQLPVPHAVPDGHDMQTLPPRPHASSRVPA
jgi:hypothetical protein